MSNIKRPPLFSSVGSNQVIKEKPKDFKGTVIKIAKMMRSEWLQLLVSIVLAIVSVVAVVFMPKVLGRTTDIIVSGVLQKQVYSVVTDNYQEMYSVLSTIDHVKQIVKDGKEDPETSQIFDSLVEHNKRVGYLINEANADYNDWDESLKEEIKKLPVWTNNILLRKLIGYTSGTGLDSYAPIYDLDMTFGEALDYFEITELDLSNLNAKVKKYFLDMPLNSGESGYVVVNSYNNSKTIGEFLTTSELDSCFNMTQSYKDIIYSTLISKAPKMDWNSLKDNVIELIVLVAVYSFLSYIQGFILVGVAQRTSYKFRYRLNEKINKLPLKYFDSTTNGEVMSLIANDVDTISTSLNQSLSQVVTSITTIIGVLIMMFTIAPLLTLIAVVCIPVSGGLITLMTKKSQKYFEKQQNSLGHVNGQIEESFAGHNVIKLFCNEKESIESFEKYNFELTKSAEKSQFYSGLMQPLSKLVGNIAYVAVCIFGGVMVINGQITIGSMQSFAQYARQFTQPINQVSSVFNTIQSTIAAAERVFSFIEENEEVETGTKELRKVIGKVSFNHVRFGYGEEIIINDFNAEVEAGQRVALVGPTGAGKTTIVKLLMRFYDVLGGNISIDDENIAEIKRQSIRENVGMVLQDAWLFNGSILENIRYGRKTATNEEVIAAAKMAYVDQFVNSLPGGYDFIINADASNISQGQKQLITIARAIVADSKILILDEATSSVDTRTEVLIQSAMNKLLQGRTSFVIAHRLSTIKDADNIFVINQGDIVEQGTHVELLKAGKYYSALYGAQFEES